MSWNDLHRYLHEHVAEWGMELDRDFSEGKDGYYYHLTIHSFGWPTDHEIVARTPKKLLEQLKHDDLSFAKLYMKSDLFYKNHMRWPEGDYLGRDDPQRDDGGTVRGEDARERS